MTLSSGSGLLGAGLLDAALVDATVAPWIVGAAVLLGAYLGAGSAPRGRLARLVPGRRRAPRESEVAGGAAGGGASGVGGVAGGGGVAAGAVGGAPVWWRRVARLGRWGSVPATDVAATVSELSALVRAGVPAATAWAYAVAGARGDPTGSALVAAAAAATSGLPVAAELDRHCVGLPCDATADLRCLAASWRVVELTGAPVADVLDRVAHSVRDAADRRDARTTALAAPLATARVLGLLPVLGLGLGELLGASPLQVLVGTPAGRVSGLAGLAFAAAGAAWTRRLLRTAARAG